MSKKSLIFFLVVFCIASASAFTTTLTAYNDTKLYVTITNTTDLYAYEINFDYTGAAAAIQPYSFLGASGSVATYGSSIKNSILSVYGSRLDSNRAGINGSGTLLNVSHSGTGNIDLRYTLAIYANGTEVYTYYNNTTPEQVVVSGDGGGGGGGSGGTITQFNITPDILNLKLIEGRTFREKIRLTNLAGKQIQITGINSGDLNQFIAAYVPQIPFYIPQDSYVDLNIDFFARKDIRPDVYTGEIKIKTPESTETLPTIFQVVGEEPLFDVITALDRDEYAPGEVAMATVDIQNFGDKKNIDVIVHYAIKNFAGEELVFEEGSYAIENYKLQLVGKLRVPRDAQLGDKLIFYVKVTYPQQDISSSASSVFTVIEPRFSPLGGAANIFLLILIPLAVIAIIIVTIVIIFNVKNQPESPEKTPQAETPAD